MFFSTTTYTAILNIIMESGESAWSKFYASTG